MVPAVNCCGVARSSKGLRESAGLFLLELPQLELPQVAHYYAVMVSREFDVGFSGDVSAASGAVHGALP